MKPNEEIKSTPLMFSGPIKIMREDVEARDYANRYDKLLLVIDLLAFKKWTNVSTVICIKKAALHHANTIHDSQQDISTDLNKSREVVSRILKQKERARTIILQRVRII